MRKWGWICLMCNVLAVGRAQVLTIDRVLEQDSVHHKVKSAATVNFSTEKQKKSLVDFTTKAECVYFSKSNYLWILVGQVDVALYGKKTNENNGFVQLRYRDNDQRKISPDFFTQYQWNGIQGMEYRWLGGCNARFKFFEKKKSDLFAGVGVFYELERWNPNLTAYAFSKDAVSVVNRNMFRLNTTAKFALKLSKSVDLTGSTFLQFPLNSHFATPRWFFDANLNFTVSKYWTFILHYDQNFDAFRPLPIDNYYYATTLGIQLKW